ncbi:MAG: LutB/LldF family L-lactate oxidation iron-sulfur protein [Acidocella sp.]|nr:LutB/LldF family L-lactate oxidation iron-sulfur protein [Acidocella sp.]
MLLTTEAFKQNATGAMADAGLQKALARAKPQFAKKRQAAMDKLPEFEALRETAKNIKNHTIANLDFYLETYAAAVEASGGHVHWCATADDARQAVLKICRDAGAKTVTKGKSMVTEEIHLNDYLEANGVTPVETDLGEYILQLRREPPSHIIGPAFHLNREDWEDTFRKVHTDLPADRVFRERRDILTEARGKLRQQFLAADVGITGANFLVAETGSSVIVTNEGNGDLTQTLPRVHVVVTGIEKIVPTIEDTLALLRVLARSATGQDMSVYTTFSTGGRRAGDPDGPQEYHVVLLDNGRSGMVGTPFQDMLRCIRCAACMNHCPVYGAVGGHAYGSTYPGPMGAVLTPMLVGVEAAGQLPNASTFCGKCESVCPVKIPLPNMMRHWRDREFERHLGPPAMRYGLVFWGFFARRPALYRLGTRFMAMGLGFLGAKRGRFSYLAFAGAWTKARDFPAPEGTSFFAQYAARQKAAR